jgi:hypothetical protein
MRLRTKRKRSSCIRQDSNPAAWHAARRSGPTIAALRAKVNLRGLVGLLPSYSQNRILALLEERGNKA